LKTQQRTFFECRDLDQLRLGEDINTSSSERLPAVRTAFEQQLTV
jgi:hypothetical protein